ncbi:MAG: fibronectin type III-like domain-contianing protein, partial [bacterium]
KIAPSGRLPETFPLDPADVPCARHFAVGNARVHYQESIYVGYRYYATKQNPVLFPFGHGLSYTAFSYSNLRVSAVTLTVPGSVEAQVDITNVGSTGGREVVQWYVENAQGSVFRPKLELRGFAKISLEPGETKTVTRRFSEMDFAYFDPAAGCFIAPPGDYRIAVMKNVAETIVTIPLTIINPAAPAPDPALLLATSYQPSKGLIMTNADFATLLGHDPGPESERRKRPFTKDDCLEDLQKTLLGRLLIRFVTAEVKKAIIGTDPAYQRMVRKSMLEVPLRSLAVQSGGKLGMRTALAIIDWINIRPFAVLARLFGRD